jgi:hypothetical protein
VQPGNPFLWIPLKNPCLKIIKFVIKTNSLTFHNILNKAFFFLINIFSEMSKEAKPDFLKKSINKNSKLHQIIELNRFKNDVISAIKQRDNFKELKTNEELLKAICAQLEVNVPQYKKEKYDKKEFIIALYNELFGNLSEVEKQRLREDIQYLFNNDEFKSSKLIRTLTTIAKKFFLCLDKLL